MFVLWNCISAIFYEDRKYCLHIFPWFLTSWTFRITSLLNLNEYQCYHHLDLSMIEGFHGFVMFSLSLSKIGWILFSNAKETLQKMLARKCSYRYRGKHMKDWKQVLIIKSLKLPNFFFDIRLSMYWQNAFENWFGRQRSLGSRKDNPSMADFGYNNNAITNQKNSN